MTRTEYHRQWRDRKRAENPEAWKLRNRELAKTWWRKNNAKANLALQNWRQQNRSKVNGYARRSYWQNIEKRRMYNRAYSKQWKLKNPEKYKAQKKRNSIREIDDKILHSLRCHIIRAIRSEPKSARTIQLLGCSIENFKIYLESKFEVGMTWNNYGKRANQWSIDHVIPCALFDMSRSEHQRRCFHFSNLQPMWHVENCRKGGRLIYG